jgi:hypothetical protein
MKIFELWWKFKIYRWVTWRLHAKTVCRWLAGGNECQHGIIVIGLDVYMAYKGPRWKLWKWLIDRRSSGR